MSISFAASIPVLDGVTPRSRSTDPITSVDAGRAADLPGSQQAVYDVMERGGSWTQGELEQVVAYSPSRIRTAVSELAAMGLVERTGEKRPTRFGRQAFVYRVVAHA